MKKDIKLKGKRLLIRAITYASVLGAMVGYGSLKESITDRAPLEPIALEQRLSSPSPIKKESQKYAVLVSGLAEDRFRTNLRDTYQMLQKEGFQPENIFILDYRGDKNDFYPVDGPASKKAVQEVFGYLKGRITTQDEVVFWFDDHGGTRKKEINGKNKELSTICLPGEDIDQIELADLASKLNPKQGLFIIDACYSGGFAEEMKRIRKPFLTITATTNQGTLGTKENSLSRFLVEGISKPSLADKNNDGKTSIQEAFDYMFDKRYPTLLIDRGVKYIPSSGEPQIKGSLNPEKTHL